MKYRLINLPAYIPPGSYAAIIDKVCDFLRQQQGILSIYQIGSIGHPGISDIDLVAIFRDGIICRVNPLSLLDKDERGAFTHSVFGIEEALFKEIHKYSFFHNYSWCWGKKYEMAAGESTSFKNSKTLKRQVALEYLLANYIGRSRERIYGVLSVRNLFLSCSAASYDLELLEVQSGDLADNIKASKEMRDNWFSREYHAEEVQTWFDSFYTSIHSFLTKHLETNKLGVPGIRNYRYSRNICIIPGWSLAYTFKGIAIPAVITQVHKKLRKINDLLNRITFSIPMAAYAGEEDSILNKRDALFRLMLKKHRTHFPYFTPLANNLQVKLLL